MSRGKGIAIALSVVLLSASVGVRGAPAAEQTAATASTTILPPVLLVSDTGINPYHVDFRLPPDFDPPLGYYPEQATLIPLTLDADSYEEAMAADAEIWGSLEVGELYAFAGTNIVGAISFSAAQPILDTSGHGTMVASSAVGQRSGSCPECRVVVNGGFGSDEVFAWALEQDWIDVISNSFADLLIANPTRPTEKLSRAWTRSGRIWFDAAGNGVIPPVNHFNSHDAPPWIVRVGTGSRPGLLDPLAATQTFDITGDQEKQLAVPGSLDAYGTGSGTSMAAPDVAGHALRLLWEARIHFDDGTGLRDGVLARTTDPARIPEQGPLSDGQLTARELEQLLFAAAHQRPSTLDLPPELSYFWEGFGYFGTRCLSAGCEGIPDAVPLQLARAILFDGAQAPEKSWAQWWWEVDQYLRGPYGGTLAPCKTDPITLLPCLQDSDWDPVGDAPGPPPG